MKLILAGVIQDLDYYRSVVEPHLDGVRARYVGVAGPEMRDKLLGGARALLHPINFNEPFGLSVVEACACGTPVVAFNRGSMPEIIDNWINGFLVSDVCSAVEAVSSLDAIARRKCRQIVQERFSRARMVEDYLGVYQKIINKNKFKAGETLP